MIWYGSRIPRACLACLRVPLGIARAFVLACAPTQVYMTVGPGRFGCLQLSGREPRPSGGIRAIRIGAPPRDKDLYQGCI